MHVHSLFCHIPVVRYLTLAIVHYCFEYTQYVTHHGLGSYMDIGHLQIRLALFTVLWVADLAVSRSAQVKASGRATWHGQVVCDVACTCLVFFLVLEFQQGLLHI